MQYQASIPMQLTQKFLDTLGYEPENKRILIIRDICTGMTLAEKNEVVFVTDDPEARDMFKNIVMFNPEFGSDDEVIYIDVENNKNAWEEFIKELSNMPKFDVAIMNPPYTKKTNDYGKRSEHLDLPIYNEVCNHAIDVVSIMTQSCANRKSCKYTSIIPMGMKVFNGIHIDTAIFIRESGKPIIKIQSKYALNGKHDWIKENTVLNSLHDHIDHKLNNEWYYERADWTNNNIVPMGYIALSEVCDKNFNILLQGESLLKKNGKRLTMVVFIKTTKQEEVKDWLLNKINPLHNEFKNKYGDKNIDRGFAKCIEWPFD